MAYDAQTQVGYSTDDPNKISPLRSLEEYRKMFEDYRSVTEPNRSEQLLDSKYYDGDQLSSDERNKLKARGQPDIVINRLKVSINGILGVMSRSRTDPRCYPRTPDDEGSADVATEALRYITQKNRWKPEKIKCFKDYLVAGSTAILVGIDKWKNVEYTRIRWEEFFHDPRSRCEDFKDARYMGIAKWMFADDVKDLWPDYDEDIEDMVGSAGSFMDESFEDRPVDQSMWLDKKARRVMVVELYHKYRRKWYKCVYYCGGVLEEGPSPYLDERGEPCCPIEAISAYVDQNNNRYGVVRDMRDLQDEINKRRSKLLHLINSSQIEATDPGAVEVDANTARKEAARPDGVIPYGWRRVMTTDMSAGQQALLAESKAEIERFGPNPAVLGRQGADTSGRALLARQQAGLVELAILFDQMDDFELRVYGQSWGRAKQYWTDPMWIRVTDDPDDPKFLHLNAPRPAPMGVMGGNEPETNDMLGMMGPGGPVMPPSGAPVGVAVPEGMPAGPGAAPEAQQAPTGPPPIGPDGKAIFGYDNLIAEIDIDIVIDTQPETATIMAEQLKDLMQLIGANPTYAEQVPFEVLVEMTPMPNKRRFMKLVKDAREAMQKAQAQDQDEKKRIGLEQVLSEIKETLSKVELNSANAELARSRVGHTEAQATATAIGAQNDTARTVHEISQPDEPASGATGGSDA